MKTKQMKHTPGPWEVHSNIGKKGELGIVAESAPCVIAHGMSEKHWPEIAQANAALIAAAPEMLEALKTLADYVFREESKQNICSSAWMDARKAIAKAEGRLA